MTWDSFGVASRELAVLVADSGYEPDLILAIARGGLLAAGALGYALAVKNLYTMNVEFYTGVDARLPVPMILPPVPDLVELRFARILVVDDVADTGHTLKIVQEFFKGRVKEVRSAVLYEKSHSCRAVRLCLETHGSMDQFSLVRQGPGCHESRNR